LPWVISASAISRSADRPARPREKHNRYLHSEGDFTTSLY
jgi:hypothetical protein